MKILFADDDIMIRKLSEILFAQTLYQLKYASNGEEAMHLCQKEYFDLILMDIEMPEMNGLEASVKIRALLGEKCPPIVALTAHSNEDLQEYGYNHSFDAVMNKPIKLDVLKTIAQDFNLL